MRSTVERGYGAAHRRLKDRWQVEVDANGATCFRCGGSVPKGSRKWDLGHTEDRTGWTGPEHVGCNRSAGGRNGAAVSLARRQGVRRPWR